MRLARHPIGEPSIALLVDIAGPVAALEIEPSDSPLMIEPADGWDAGRIYVASDYVANTPSGQLARVFRWTGHVIER